MLPLTACTDWSKSKFCRNIKSDLYDTGWSNYCRWWDWQLCPKYIFLSQTCKQPSMRVFWWREIWDLLWKQILWNSQKWHFRCPKRRYKTTFISPQLVGNMASETSESGLFTLGLLREKSVLFLIFSYWPILKFCILISSLWRVKFHKNSYPRTCFQILRRVPGPCAGISQVYQGGRSCTKAQRAFAKKFGLGRKF